MDKDNYVQQQKEKKGLNKWLKILEKVFLCKNAQI